MKVLGITLATMFLTAASAMAANNSNTDTTPCTENVKETKSFKKENRQPKTDLFEGITLSASQKEKIEQLESKRKAAREEKKKMRDAQKKQSKESAQPAKKDGSSKDIEARKQQKTARMAERKSSYKTYLEEVKAIIGPQNYVIFLENAYVNGGRNKKGSHEMAKGNGRHDKSKHFNKGAKKHKENRGEMSVNRPATH